MKKVMVLVCFCFIIFLFAQPQQVPKAPPEKLKPKPKVGPIMISGNVTVPDGRGLDGVKIRIYELRGSNFVWVKDVATTKAGYFSTFFGEQWFNKKLKIIPKYASYREGENFSPQEDIFFVTSAKMDNRNFRYTGPLPDLACSNVHHMPSWAICCITNMVQTPTGVSFTVEGSTFPGPPGFTTNPFKVRLRGRLGESNEMIIDFPGVKDGQDWAKTIEIHGARVENIRIDSVEIDIEDSVIEKDERNNLVHGPFY